MKRNIKGEVDSQSCINGKVEIKEGAVIENSLIRGPVSIAENCQVRNSSIGPFTSIGAKTVIEDSSIEYSVILENSRIFRIQHLADSIIGRDTEVVKQEQNFGKIKLFIGDDDVRVEL